MEKEIKITWRDGELSYKEFANLPRKEKDNYLFKLLELRQDLLSYNDKHILSYYTKQEEPENNKFLEL